MANVNGISRSGVSGSQFGRSCLDHVRLEERIKIEWPFRGHYYSPIGLHTEVLDFFHYISPMPYEEDMRRRAVSRLKYAVNKYWSDAKVHVYGSFATGLYLPTSDVDILIKGNLPEDRLDHLSQILVLERISSSEDITVLSKAAVPIVKYVDNESHIKLDVCFNISHGEKTVPVVKSYIDLYPNITPLYLLIRQLLVERGLSEVFSGGLGSYALFLMLVSFFQRHHRPDARSTRANLGVLLLEFFELYGLHFNYNELGIRIADGGLYFLKRESYLSSIDSGYSLCIEDPCQTSNDVGKGCFRLYHVQKIFVNCYHTLDGAFIHMAFDPSFPKRTMLSRILRVPKSTIEFRQNLYYIHQRILSISLGSNDTIGHDDDFNYDERIPYELDSSHTLKHRLSSGEPVFPNPAVLPIVNDVNSNGNGVFKMTASGGSGSSPNRMYTTDHGLT